MGRTRVQHSFVRIAPPGRCHSVTNRRCYKGRMTIELSNHEVLSDPELLVEVRRLAGQERKATARLIAALGELDARRLYLGEGCSSLFTYCTQILHLSEHAAYGRIEAARAARKWPAILDLLADGAVHLTAIGLLAPHLTTENHQRVLGSARHKTKREVEEIVASLRPQPPVASSVRKAASAESDSGRPFSRAVAGAGRPRAHNAGTGTRAVRKRASEAACGGQAARAGTLQSAVHCLTRDVSEAARGAGSPEAPTAGRGSGWDLRPRADAAARGAAQGETRRGSAAEDDNRVRLSRAPHPCVGEAWRLGTRRRSVRVRWRGRAMH